MTAKSWRLYPFDPAIAAWATHALPAARKAIDDPANANWFRCAATWFAGVDCLPNDPEGRHEDGPSLSGTCFDDVPKLPLHRAQISAIYPRYPQPMEGESDAAARYRVSRDAAHVDGLLPVGRGRRRHLREPHAYILGVPLTDNPPGASPPVVWEGSHLIMLEAFKDSFRPFPPETWSDIDITDAYHAARRVCFERCRRVTVSASPGQAVLIHRLALHGIAPWSAPDGPPRIVAYFRPQGTFDAWLSA